MKSILNIVLAIVLLFTGREAHSQGHAANWIFGDGFHLKFDETGPTVLPFIEDYYASEGASCISDKTGDLLFYSNTIQVWNRDFLPLFNSDTFPGYGDPPWSTKSNGSLFLPWPGSTSERFYAYLNMSDADDKLYISKIDVNLDGGLGGILDEYKYQLVWNSEVSEQLNAVRHANGRDWWIIARKGILLGDEFIIALLTPNGIIDIGVQSCGYLGTFRGALTFSTNGDLLALASSGAGSCITSPPTVALYSFDRCNGQIDLIDTLLTRSCGQSPYDVDFSIDGTKLYYSLVDKTKLYQASLIGGKLVDTLIFELRGSTSLAVVGGGIEMAIDGRLYVNYARLFPSVDLDVLTEYLGVVSLPELFGLESQFDTLGLYLNGRFNTTVALPNFPNYDLGPLVGSPCDTLSPVDTTQTSIPVFPQGTTTWSVIPTISDGLFAIQGAANGTLVVYNLYGREVFREFLTNARSFDLSALPAGLYWVTVQSEDGIWYPARKIVRQ